MSALDEAIAYLAANEPEHAEKSRIELAALRGALEQVLVELVGLTYHEKCDHAVNICWCGTFAAMENARAVLKPRASETGGDRG